MVNLPLTKLAETTTTITLGWTPIPCLGYVLYADGVRKSNSWDPLKSSWKTNKATEIKVVALGAAAEGVYPPIAPPPVPVVEVFPGDNFAAKLATVTAGGTLLLRGGVHPRRTFDRSFPADSRVTVRCEAGTLVKGITLVGDAGGYVFDGLYTQVLPTDTPNLADIGIRAFNINGPVHDVLVIRSKIEGSNIAFSPYCGAPDWCANIELRDSEIWGAWGDLIHSNGCKGLVIDHNLIHDPRHLTSEHHDGFQPERTEDYQFTRNTVTWQTSEGHYTGPNNAYLGQGIMVSGGSGTCRNGVIANNLVHHYNGRPLNLNGAVGLLVYNNTFLHSGDDIGITMGSGTSGLEVWNNITDMTWLEGPSPAFYDYNWLTRLTGTNVHGPHEWTGDPKLDSLYRPVAGSPVISKGLTRSGAPAVNLDGSVRVPPPNLGAY